MQIPHVIQVLLDGKRLLAGATMEWKLLVNHMHLEKCFDGFVLTVILIDQNIFIVII
jgi:hypothetical protein